MVAVIRTVRLLIPLVAVLGEAGENAQGRRVDKSQELSIVTVAAPDGRAALPVFSSVAAMTAWNPRARPVPAAGTRVALAAASEGTELVILDPTSPGEFAVRRPALWAIAQERDWVPATTDPEVLTAFRASVRGEVDVVRLAATAGDPDARLAAPELIVQLALRPGLDRASLDALLGRVQERWAADAIIAERVDSVALRLASVD